MDLEFFLIAKKKSYPPDYLNRHHQKVHFSCPRAPRGTQRCPTGSAGSESFKSYHHTQQQALKFLKWPKKQKSYPSRVTKQTLIGGPLQVPKGAQRYPEGPLRVTLIKKEYDTIHQTLLWALKFLKSPKKQKSYLLQYLCEHPKGVHCRRLGVPTGTQRH